MNTPRSNRRNRNRRMCLWVPVMTLALGVWVAGCSTPSTNHSPSDDFALGDAYSLIGPGQPSSNLDIDTMQRAFSPGTDGDPGNRDFAGGSFDVLGQLGNSGSTDAPGQIVIVDEQSEGAFNRNGSWGTASSRHATGGTTGTPEEIIVVSPNPEGAVDGHSRLLGIGSRNGREGTTGAPGQIVIVDEQSEEAFNRNGSRGDASSRHATGGTTGTPEEIIIVSPNLEGVVAAPGIGSRHSTEGTTAAPGQIVIVDEQSDGAVTRKRSWGNADSRHADGGTIGAPEQIVVVSPKLEGAFLGQGFLSMTDVGRNGEAKNIFITQLPSDVSVERVPDPLMVFVEDPNRMIVADARNGHDLRYKGNAWDSGVVSPEPTTNVNGNIYFAFNSWRLNDSMVDQLVASAKWLKTHEGSKVMIEGHCDERGSREYNVVLGAKRASVVKSFLRDLGVRANQIVTISYGKERPVCLEGSATCHAKNRRAFIQEM